MEANHPGLADEQVIQLASTAIEQLGNVRTHPQLQAARDAQWIWLRGIKAGRLPLALQQLPAYATYRLDAEGRLFPRGKLTPTAKLPSLDWQPLTQFLPLELPPAALPAEVNTKYSIQLRPSDTAQPGTALLCTLTDWKAYAETAAQVRLRQLHFAVSQHHQVLILGQPLPPLPGKEYWQRDQLLLPAGFDLELPLLSKLIPTDPSSLLLFDEAGECQEIPLKTIVPATRSGIRLTASDE